MYKKVQASCTINIFSKCVIGTGKPASKNHLLDPHARSTLVALAREKTKSLALTSCFSNDQRRVSFLCFDSVLNSCQRYTSEPSMPSDLTGRLTETQTMGLQTQPGLFYTHCTDRENRECEMKDVFETEGVSA